MEREIVIKKTVSAVPENLLRAQRWKFYFVCFAWPVFLFLLPYVYATIGWWSILFMIFPGVFLFNWMALLMHECWHRYMPNINNKFFYNTFSWMLFADPQLFRLLHGRHHTHVTTWDDREVHAFGEIKNRVLRAINNWLEIFGGMLYVLLAWHIIVPRHPKYKAKYSYGGLISSLIISTCLLGSVGYAAHLVLGVTFSQIGVSYLAIYWLGALFLHHSTIIQHGNVVVDGDLDERNSWVRSLKPSGPLEMIFLILTHQDHVIHHILPKVYARPFRNNLLEALENAVLITFRDYLTILGDMLVGRVSNHEGLGIRTGVSKRV